MKSSHFNRTIAVHGTNGYSKNDALKTTDENHVAQDKKPEKFENGDSSRIDLDLAASEAMERDLQKRKNVVSTLLQSSHWGYGNSNGENNNISLF